MNTLEKPDAYQRVEKFIESRANAISTKCTDSFRAGFSQSAMATIIDVVESERSDAEKLAFITNIVNTWSE